MRIVRRLTSTVLVLTLLAAIGIGTGYALDLGDVRDTAQRVAGLESDPAPVVGGAGVGTGPGSTRQTTPAPDSEPAPAATPDPRSDPVPDPTPDPTPAPTSAPAPAPTPEPEPQGGPPLMSPGETSDAIKVLQARLRQIQWFNTDVTGYYGDVTTAAVTGFQAKREIPETGYVDQETLDRLLAMTTEPTADELANRLAPSASNVPGALDARCTTGHVLCVDKSSSTLRWVVDGKVRTTLDVRFGAEYTPTREGAFSVDSKSRDHVSSLYGSAMPFAMFFSGGQAVHYSSDFAARGYAGASHGCVNVRDYDGLAALFDQVQVGDSVIVYRS